MPPLNLRTYPMPADAGPPSGSSAWGVVTGRPGALQKALVHTLSRGALIYLGARVAGVSHNASLRSGLGGAAMIEVLLLGWAEAARRRVVRDHKSEPTSRS